MTVSTTLYWPRNGSEIEVALVAEVTGSRGHIEEIAVEVRCACGSVLDLTLDEQSLAEHEARKLAKAFIDDLRDRAMGT